MRLPSKATLSRYAQYTYFLRMSLLAWLFLPALCVLDWTGVTAALSRGIVTLDSPLQSFYAAFFVVAINMAVLITARNTVRNGPHRFRTEAPEPLFSLMTDGRPAAVWKTLAIIHTPTLLTLLYLIFMGVHEGERIEPLSMLGGVVAGALFWYLVSLFYYWNYRPAPFEEFHPQGEFSEPAALIFPEYDWLFGDIAICTPPPRLTRWIDRVTRWMLKHGTCAGYAPTQKGPMWELHYLSTLSLVGVLIIYLFLYPLTSPVLRSKGATYGEIAFCVLLNALFLRALAHTNYTTHKNGGTCRWARPVKLFFMLLALGTSAGFIAMLLYDRVSGSPRLSMAFPTLCSVLVLVSFLLWLFAGAAFFTDRYRIPLITIAIVAALVPKMMLSPLGGLISRYHHPMLAEIFDSDHYYSVHPLDKPVQLAELPTPAQTLALRVKNPNDPYIIVTASGGGIRAAEWTAQVMANLEKAFGNDRWLRKNGYTFHDHLLLASSVSGGSVGMEPFLLEYTADDPAAEFPVGNTHLFDRITRGPGCSSLEAVGWGLSYHDFYRLMLPISLPRSQADDNSPDRSWALATAINRNLHDPHCHTDAKSLMDKEHPEVKLPTIQDGEGFTLFGAAVKLQKGLMPAFTMNTTAAETGSRFLLSNYYVPPDDTCGSDFTPAESFLQVYAAEEHDCRGITDHPTRYADLPMATAARLSATFPVVSSGTRIPLAYAPHAYHFLDGGYYDNDGTASAIEFLKSALDEAKDPKSIPRSIVWIEIRDDDGGDVSNDMDDITGQTVKTNAGQWQSPPWTPATQAVGILEGLWNAGHTSIARRNRRELCLFEKAYADKLSVHHVVFTIPDDSNDNLSPLSWNLTTGQQKSITERTNSPTNGKWIRSLIHWVAQARNKPPMQAQCQVTSEPKENTVAGK